MLRNCILLATVCLAGLVSFIGCDSGQPISSLADNSDSIIPLQRSLSQTSTSDAWTVLIYIAADNDLEDDAESIISTLGQFDYSGGNLNVVAMVDSRSTAGTRVYQTDGGVDLVASNDGEKNTADPAVLEEFVQYGTSQFPSEKTMLIVKAPGYAWRGICFDETNNAETMSIDGLAGALKGKGLDLLVFDASYMGLLEVSYELKDAASYMVATQSTITDRGMPYDMVIPYMLLYPGISPHDLAVDLVDGYTDYYYRDFSTISAYDLSKAGAVGEAFCHITWALQEQMRDNRTVIAPARDHSEIGLNNAVDQSEYLHDLWVFFSDLEAIEDNSLREAIQELKLAFSEAVIAEGHSFRYREIPHGMSFWFPPSIRKSVCDYVTYDGRFFYSDSGLDIVEESLWLICLEDYYVVAKIAGNRHHNKYR